MTLDELYGLFAGCPVVTTDSRDCPPGSVFVALKGETFDGNRFARQALEKGCAVAVVDEAEYATDPRCVLVDDCLATFQALARHHRRQYDIPVIGITGTNGKTTTKELVAAVLSKRYSTLSTSGNFNNDIGVPKTLMRIAPHHDIAVVEMGASHPGDIRRLADTAEPTCGLITNVGKAHLQGFGSLEGVVATKGELYDFLRGRAGAEVFIDAGNPLLGAIAGGLPLLKYGMEGCPGAAVEGRLLKCDPLLSFEWRGREGVWHRVQTHLIGSYNIANMLAAACVGQRFGVAESDISSALEDYVPSNSRSQLEQTAHNRLIVDAYNANPTSMAAALDNFRLMDVSPKMAIVGDMRELGAATDAEHRKVIEQLQAVGADVVWLVGPTFARLGSPFRTFADVGEVMDELRRCRPEGYTILIKGSNGQKLFLLPELL